MTTIEEKVLAMKFDGKQFLAGIDQSLTAVDKLNKGLKLQEGAKGLDKIGTAAQKQVGALAHIESAVQRVADRFKTMGIVATTAIQNVTNQALYAGQNLVKSLTIEPVMQGFREYETNMNSIQTILANTQAAGTNLEDVTHALDELNHYSDQTIYNFAEMAKNIGTFTAAGVDLKTSTAAIKGIANLAALSGSNSEQASGAMYQLSQAISSGRVSLEDWNSVVNAGMGGTVFQRALAQNAVKLGTLNDGAVKLKGNMKNVTIEGKSFRESITAKPGKESWLTSKVLTQTLAQFTGDLDKAALAQMGFKGAAADAILEQAKMARAAATEVKTFSQLMGTLKESAGSGWSQTWKTVFGDFEEAKKLFTDVNNVLGGMIGASADARNKVLGEWASDKLGGRKAVIEGISNAFKALMGVLKPIGQAFRDIFPPTTGKQLADMSKNFAAFTKNLIPGKEAMENIKRTARGFFALLDIGWMIIKEVVSTIFDLIGVATEGAGGFLKFTGNIGDFIVKVRDAIKNGTGLKDTFKAIGTILEFPIRMVKALVGFIGQLVNGVAGTEIFKNLNPIGTLGEFAAKAWETVLSIMENIGIETGDMGTKVADFFKNLGSRIADFISGFSWSDVFAGLGSGFVIVLIQGLRDLFGGGGLGGIVAEIKGAFEALTGSLEAMQNMLKATTLLQLAAAVLILAFAMDKISKLDPNKIAASGGAITVLMGDLVGAMVLLDKFLTSGGFTKLPLAAITMILLATAISILASAMSKMAQLDWEGVAKGLLATTVLIGALTAAVRFMQPPANMISAGVGIVILAAAIKILASAVEDMSALSWGDMAKGLVGVGSVLLALGLFARFGKVNDLGLKQSLGILLLATAVSILAKAIDSMSKAKGGDTAEGLLAMSAALVAIAIALRLMPPATILSAAAVFIVAASLGMIADALERFAEFDRGDIAGSLITMGIALNIISVSMRAMMNALPGAVALLVVAGALRILLPVLQGFAAMNIGDIAAALGVLAGVFIIIGVAGLLLAPIVPAILGLGIGIAALGIGLALVGGAVFLFASGLLLLSTLGAGAAVAIGLFIGKLLDMVPLLVDKLAKALIALADVVVKAAPAFGKAIMAVLNTFIDVIVEITPKVVDAILKLLTMLLDKLAEYVPRMVDAGLKLITGILEGIAKNIGKMARAATNVIVAFINAIGENVPKVADAGAKMVVRLVNGIADAIRNNSEAMGKAGGNLATAIIQGMVNGLKGGVGAIVDAARGVASSALNAAKDFLGIASPSKEFVKIGKFVIEGFRKGLDGNKDQIYQAFSDLKKMLKDFNKDASKDVDELEKKLKKLRNSGASAKEIAKTKKALAQAKKEEKASDLAYQTLTKKLDDETHALGKLAVQYDAVTAKLDAAKKTLEDAKKTRDDYNKSIADQYGNALDPTGDTTATDYITNLKKQVEDTKTFTNQIQQLRAMGLNDETYKDLLSAGTSALPFVQDLLKGGKDSVTQINDLNKQLDDVSTSLGKTASTQLYQAAVDSAAGLVKGLQNQQANIEKQMDKIADAMVKAIKKKLGIKSPSRVFAEVGGYSGEGLARGLKDSSALVSRSAETLGNQAVISLRKTLSNTDKMALSGVDMTPVIRPKLDLTDIQSGAGKIGSMLPSAKLNLSAAYSNAASAAAAVRAGQASGEEYATASAGATLNYVQNNYSPKAISEVERYRQTKNQLSTVKGALDANARKS